MARSSQLIRVLGGPSGAGLIVKSSQWPPSECSAQEIGGFCGLLDQAFGPRDRSQEIRAAHSLVYLHEGQALLGIAALKTRSVDMTRDVFQSAGVSLPEKAALYELGWVVVDQRHRGRRLSRILVEAALQAAGDACVYATCHDTNAAVHRTLRRYGFTETGTAFYSERHGKTLVLFTRAGRPTSA